ncbi:MAG: TatD family hydrolase [Bacteroidia bacterium]
MSQYINLHTHRKPRVLGEIAIRNGFLKTIDFSKIDYPVSLGLHPWHVHKTNIDWALAQIKNSHAQIIAIGECGLDRVIQTPIELQLTTFHQQIELAIQFNLPVIVHCVKAYSDFASIAKQYPNMQFVLHGFSGNEETLQMLLAFKNVYFSVGKYLFNPTSNASLVIGKIPINHLFLETDTSKYLIDEVYKKAAQILEIEETVLKNQIFDNFANLFKEKK